MFLEAVTSEDDDAGTLKAHNLLEMLWSTPYDPLNDAYLRAYAGASTMTIQLTDVLSVTVPMDRPGMGLVLAEMHQLTGNITAAIQVVESLEPTTHAAVSLAELYAQAERWDDIITMTDGLANVDDFTTYLLVQRGVAMRHQRYYTASREAFKTALAPRSRQQALRHLALIERAATYQAEGKRAMARKDLEKVLAEDSAHPGIRELIEQTNVS